MASSLSSSPTSLQLRSALRPKPTPFFFLTTRPPPPPPPPLRLPLLPLPSPLRLHLPPPPSANSPDAFSGWANSPNAAGGDDNSNSNSNSNNTNALSALLAAALFFASIAFAAFSFTQRTKVQMHPITSDQSTHDNGPQSELAPIQCSQEDSSHTDTDTALHNQTQQTQTISSQSNPHSSQINPLYPQESDASANSFDAPPSSVIQEQDDSPILHAPQPIFPDSDQNTLNLSDDDSNPQETLNAPAMPDSLPVQSIASQVVILQTGDVIETPQLTKDAVSLDQHDTFDTFNEADSLQETEPLGTEDPGAHNVEDEKIEANTEKPDGSFSHAGIPAPSLLPAALQVPPGNVLVPAVVDQSQHQAFAALQALKVIEEPAKPGELCTRREYARWLVAASSLSRNTVSKVYPAMYIENVTELAFDDITPDDPDFSCIQGLAEAGLISSKLSRPRFGITDNEDQDKILFSPESPLSRQDLVSWKMALEKRYLPEIDRNAFLKASGYIDIDKINPDAWPALVADLATGEQSITALAFGYTRLFQPGKPVTKGQAAIALSSGESYETVNEELARIEAEALAESAVNVHTALVAQVEMDINAAYEKDLAKEREKVETLEKLAEEARLELKRLKEEREEEDNTIAMGRAAVESEMEVLLKLKHEMEKELEGVMSKKMEVSFERERISRLRQEIENENQSIAQLKYDLEVERKALAMARAWAEEEAKRAREQARTLEEARSHWEQRGIKVVVDEELQDDTSAGISWLAAGETSVTEGKGVSVQQKIKVKVETLKASIAQRRVQIIAAFERLREKILSLIVLLKGAAAESSKRGAELWAGVSEKAKRVVEDCKEGVEKITQKPKS